MADGDGFDVRFRRKVQDPKADPPSRPGTKKPTGSRTTTSRRKAHRPKPAPSGQYANKHRADDAPSASAMALAARIAKAATTPPAPATAPPAAPAPVIAETADASRPRVYQLALQLSSRVFTIVELAAMERYFVRDRLEKLSMQLPKVLLTAVQIGTRRERTLEYVRAYTLTNEVLSIIDILGERGTVEPEPIRDAQASAIALRDLLHELGRAF